MSSTIPFSEIVSKGIVHYSDQTSDNDNSIHSYLALHDLDNVPVVSIDKSLKDKKFANVIKEAKAFAVNRLLPSQPEPGEVDHLTDENGLNVDEICAIHIYTQQTYLLSDLNQKLRSNELDEIKPYYLYLKLLLSALNKLPSVTHSCVYRAIDKNVSKIYKQGEIYTSREILSCSSLLNSTQECLPLNKERSLFIIHNPIGVDITSYTTSSRAHKDETHIIISPGTSFKVKSIVAQDKLYIYQLFQTQNSNLLHHDGNEGVNNTSTSIINMSNISQSSHINLIESKQVIKSVDNIDDKDDNSEIKVNDADNNNKDDDYEGILDLNAGFRLIKNYSVYREKYVTRIKLPENLTLNEWEIIKNEISEFYKSNLKLIEVTYKLNNETKVEEVPIIDVINYVASKCPKFEGLKIKSYGDLSLSLADKLGDATVKYGVKHLDIYSPLVGLSAGIIKNLIKPNNKIIKLNINSKDESYIVELSNQCVDNLSNLQSLSLSANSLDSSIYFLANAFKKLTQLQELTISARRTASIVCLEHLSNNIDSLPNLKLLSIQVDLWWIPSSEELDAWKQLFIKLQKSHPRLTFTPPDYFTKNDVWKKLDDREVSILSMSRKCNVSLLNVTSAQEMLETISFMESMPQLNHIKLDNPSGEFLKFFDSSKIIFHNIHSLHLTFWMFVDDHNDLLLVLLTKMNNLKALVLYFDKYSSRDAITFFCTRFFSNAKSLSHLQSFEFHHEFPTIKPTTNTSFLSRVWNRFNRLTGTTASINQTNAEQLDNWVNVFDGLPLALNHFPALTSLTLDISICSKEFGNQLMTSLTSLHKLECLHLKSGINFSQSNAKSFIHHVNSLNRLGELTIGSKDLGELFLSTLRNGDCQSLKELKFNDDLQKSENAQRFVTSALPHLLTGISSFKSKYSDRRPDKDGQFSDQAY